VIRIEPLNRLWAYIQRLVFSDELSFSARTVNMVCLVGTGSLILATLSRIVMGASLQVDIIMFSFCFIGAFFIYLTNKYQLYPGVFWILLTVICDILLPTAFFFIGGASSGVAAFVVMSTTCILLTTEGKVRVIMTVVHLLLMTACFIFGAYHPEWVAVFNPRRPLVQAVDNIQCFTIATLFVGLALTFQRYMYSQEKVKVDRATEESERQREVVLALFNANPHINILFDDKLQLIDFNPAALEFVEGLADADDLKTSLPELLSQATPPVQPNGRPSADLQTWLRKTALDGRVSFETTLFLRNIEYNVSVVMKRIPYGESFAIVVYVVDNSELYKTRREALASAHAKSEFLANMSHEIRTPLNAVISMASIGHSALEIERKDYAFNQITDAAGHLLGVINDILDMSKIEANKLDLDKRAFNVEAVLHRAANVISFRTSEKKQQFIVRIDTNVPTGIISDDQRLVQVITNLLSNAVKFTPEGGFIEVTARQVGQKENFVTIEFSVHDTGIGIPQENLGRIFRSFEQVENNTTRKFGGTGLGLAISQRFVEMMGGKFNVTSEPGQGSTFSFTIKAERVRGMPGPRLDSLVKPRDLRFLVIGSEESSLEYCGALIRRLGISCDFAQRRNEALELLEKTQYDACFLEWNIKGANSVELARRIKTQGMADRIVMNLYPFELAEAEGNIEKGLVDGYLTKPLFLNDCVILINRLFGEGDVEEDEASTEEQEDFSGFCILLAEDLEINWEIVCALLEPLGFEIQWAKNGREALEMYKKNPSAYDLILMDMQMPEMDGLEATRRIRDLSDPRARKIPIVALTANVFKEDIDNSLAAGMNDHLGKPLDFEELLKKLNFYLKGT
jgi:signal transduction histidine kinase/DNA-binding response OmpR family regulator